MKKICDIFTKDKEKILKKSKNAFDDKCLSLLRLQMQLINSSLSVEDVRLINDAFALLKEQNAEKLLNINEQISGLTFENSKVRDTIVSFLKNINLTAKCPNVGDADIDPRVRKVFSKYNDSLNCTFLDEVECTSGKCLKCWNSFIGMFNDVNIASKVTNILTKER